MSASIEGFFDFSYVNNVEYLYSQLAGMLLNYDTRVVFSVDESSTAELIRKIYTIRNLNYILNIMKDKRFDLICFVFQTLIADNYKALLLSAINVSKKERIYHAMKFFGISRRKLSILFGHFGNVNNMQNAKSKDYRNVKGVGMQTVKRLKKALNSDIFEDGC